MIDALRIALGIPFVLFVPGYAVVCALYGRDMPERAMTVALALALSTSSAILAGLALYAVDVRLDARSMLLAQLAVAVGAGTLAFLRRRATPRASVPVAADPRMWMWGASVLVCVVAFAAMLAFSREPLENRSVAGYTSLWAHMRSGDRLQVSVASSELKRVTYQLVASAGGERLITERITLDPGKRWNGGHDVGRPMPQVVDVRLYRLPDLESVYRSVTLRS
jgi:hypothetical protein